MMVHVGGNPPYLKDMEPYFEKGTSSPMCSMDAAATYGTLTEHRQTHFKN